MATFEELQIIFNERQGNVSAYLLDMNSESDRETERAFECGGVI